MALDVLPMVEDDLSDYCRIHFAAFSGGMGQFFARASGQRDQAFVESQHKALLEDPTTAFMKAVDPETGAIVGCAKYHRYYTVRSEEEVRAAHAAPPPPEGAMPEAWNEFFGWLEEARVKYMTGKACWFLSVLATDPVHHRRGAGSALLRWGCEYADNDKLPIYLESSPMAYPLYKRFGFEHLERRVFELSKYGGEGIEHNTAMLRQPKETPLN